MAKTTTMMQEILGRKSGEAERPKPIPGGHWLFLVQKPVFGKDRTGNQHDFVDFPLKPIQPMDDVDEEAIEAAGGLEKITKRTLRNRKYLTDDALWAIDEFLFETCEIEAGGRSYKQTIPEAAGKEVIGEIVEAVSKDGKRPISYVENDTLMSPSAWEEQQEGGGIDEDDED